MVLQSNLGGMAKAGVDFTILLLENDENDVFMFRRLLSRLNFQGQVRVAASGGEARRYLLGEGQFADRNYYPIPHLIVSDLVMPQETGLEFLAWIRGHPHFQDIPFVMFSGSGLARDEMQAKQLGVSDYMTKTADFHELMERGLRLSKYWQPTPSEPPPPETPQTHE